MMRKFKKTILAAVAAVSMMMSLVACGSSENSKKFGTSKEDYENDIKELMELDEFTDVETADEMKDFLDGIKVSTKEGNDVKKNLEKAVDLLEEAEKLYENLDEDDDMTAVMEEYYDIMEKYESLGEEMNKTMEAFIEAAEEAGVEENFLEDLDY